jgi:hypothetical protein
LAAHDRDEIIGGVVARWARTAGSWYPGAMIHQIGSRVIEPFDAGEWAWLPGRR